MITIGGPTAYLRTHCIPVNCGPTSYSSPAPVNRGCIYIYIYIYEYM